MSILRVISGGQTGADMGGLRAAKAWGFEIGGYLPEDGRNEDGPVPEEFSKHMIKLPGAGYRERTIKNIETSDITLLFVQDPKRMGFGSQLTYNQAKKRQKLYVMNGVTPSLLAAAWQDRWEVVNVAGNRESSAPGIELRVETFLGKFFRLVNLRR